jgi:hypothetical protein
MAFVVVALSAAVVGVVAVALAVQVLVVVEVVWRLCCLHV